MFSIRAVVGDTVMLNIEFQCVNMAEGRRIVRFILCDLMKENKSKFFRDALPSALP